MKVLVPERFRIQETFEGNRVVQLDRAASADDAHVVPFQKNKSRGYVVTPKNDAPFVVLSTGSQSLEGYSNVLRKKGIAPADDVLDLVNGKWDSASDGTPKDSAQLDRMQDRTRNSWTVTFQEETADKAGLRPPQLGALYAALSHFSIYEGPATIVMPTGTGKTETMLAILAAVRCERLLVVAPTDALRHQLAEKFTTFGILKNVGVVPPESLFPLVGTLQRGMHHSGLLEFVQRCNVVVTTVALAARWTETEQREIASKFSHLFIDEAHHLGAVSWQTLRDAFEAAHVLQFTATPYRNDDRRIEGRFIFDYPLGKAQRDGYFKKINFTPVLEFDPRKRDLAIAGRALEQLKTDWDLGHVLMARVNSVPRAREVAAVYRQLTDLEVAEVHSQLSAAKRREVRTRLAAGGVRILICVDMLGEGFDLPELKIAAFHDVRQSLPITLQLAGRFTRSRPDLGDATAIANIGDVSVNEELRKLFQRDADWNELLPIFSDQAIKKEFDLWEFLGGFKNFPKEISLQNIKPAMSATVYRTRSKEWNPGRWADGIRGFDSLDRVYSDVNSKEDSLVALTAQRVPLKWARIDDIYSWDWQLYLLFWDRAQQLLFIHNSSNAGHFASLAKAVCGEDVEHVQGPIVFRAMAGINRLRFNNVGLLEQLGRLIRFTMRAGSDVEPALSEAQK